ncbi:hypothetical protein [Hylemonella gracilis]|uniref:hypothetical protein n=1 Tax=Hylemonella gracilis TaxID=80880 RepID=UPI001F5FF955
MSTVSSAATRSPWHRPGLTIAQAWLARMVAPSSALPGPDGRGTVIRITLPLLTPPVMPPSKPPSAVGR